MNTTEQQTFADGKEIKENSSTIYLGKELNNKANIREEVSNIIREVSKTWHRLNEYWKAANASRKWKITVFDAVIRNKLLYALKSAELPKSQINRLDAFQIRGLRGILKMKHPFHDRKSTDEKVLENATIEAYRNGPPEVVARNANKHIETFSDMYKRQKNKLLGHVLRAPDTDPMKQVAFKAGTAREVATDKRRVGNPRVTWQWSAKKSVWKEFRHEAPKVYSRNPNRVRSFKGSHRQDRFVNQWAEQRNSNKKTKREQPTGWTDGFAGGPLRPGETQGDQSD